MTSLTEIKTNSHDGQRLKPECEVRILMDSYSKIFDQWKVHNDNYFKRVQVVMGILQAGLFLAVLGKLSPFPKSCADAILPIFLGILGIILSLRWVMVITKQAQYLELDRRILRNLESRLTSLGVSLEYFTAESLVFGPHRKNPPNLNTATIETVELVKCMKRHLMRFRWSGETYPDPKDGKGLYSIVKVSGRLVYFERGLAWFALCVWILVIALVVANVWTKFI